MYQEPKLNNDADVYDSVPDNLLSLLNAQVLGRTRFDQGAMRDDNPFKAGTPEREWWDAGWCNAMEDWLK